MRFDEETWDNVYEIPAELRPVIQHLVTQSTSQRVALERIYTVTQQFIEHLPDDVAWNRAMMSMINQIQDLVPEGLKPL